jgi:hypothetical protein
MIASIKLPLTFDPNLLQADLERIAPDDWVRHFNQTYYDGEWAGIALRSSGGDTRQIYPDPVAAEPLADTPILARCPNLSDVLAAFQCPLKSARLLRLTAGSSIREHRDYNLGYEDGEVRLHIPLTSSGEVEFFLDGERIDMNEGDCWYLNFNLPHRVINGGPSDRIHLVVDCVLNDWLQSLILTGAATMQCAAKVTDEVQLRGGWKEFHQAVLDDPMLQARLRVTEDRKSFTRIAIKLGREIGFQFSESEVYEAMSLARRVWVERWIE